MPERPEFEDLYREFLRFVEVLRPLAFVMENVPQLATHDQGRVANQIREDFERHIREKRCPWKT